MERLKLMSINYGMDLLHLTEVNNDWRLSHKENTILNDTKGWKQHRRVQVSVHQKKTLTNKFKVEGTAMIVFDSLAFRITNQLADNRELGRWSKYKITGKSGLHTSIINCYCSVISKLPGSLYSQHLVYMSDNKDKIPACIVCQRHFFWL